MAAETDKKTRKGLNKCLNSLEDVAGTLAAIEPTHSSVVPLLSKSRAFVAAALAAIYRLQHEAVQLFEGRSPDDDQLELSFDEAAVRRFPQMTDADREAIRTVQELAPADEEDEEAFDSATVARLLLEVQPQRPWTRAAVAAWTSDQRQSAAFWARCVRDGEEMPQPKWCSARQLEEIEQELDEPVVRRQLLALVGVDPGEEVWSEELWRETSAWAMALAFKRRGDDVEVPEVPEHLVPITDVFETVKWFVHTSDGEITAQDIATFVNNKEHQPALGLVIATLEAMGEISEGSDGFFSTSETKELKHSVLAYAAAFRELAGGGQVPSPAVESVDNVVHFLKAEED